MIYWGHGSSAVVIGVLLATFVLRAMAGRRRPSGGGQRSGAGFLVPPARRGPGQGPVGGPGAGPGSPHTATAGPDSPPSPGEDPGVAGPVADEHHHRPGFTGIPAGWLPDPSGRHERRYWSGRSWTEHVTSGGVPGSDPPPGDALGSEGR